MDSNTAGAQYNRWNEDNINLNVAGTDPLFFTDIIRSVLRRVYNRYCTGTLGIALKVGGAVAALVAVYMIGYVTGYYVHKC
uniref:Small integral membrane protein 1 n=1 Tax=Esox lucius TaxID=8010 RepID=A0A3P8YN13_ESOLU